MASWKVGRLKRPERSAMTIVLQKLRVAARIDAVSAVLVWGPTHVHALQSAQLEVLDSAFDREIQGDLLCPYVRECSS